MGGSSGRLRDFVIYPHLHRIGIPTKQEGKGFQKQKKHPEKQDPKSPKPKMHPNTADAWYFRFDTEAVHLGHGARNLGVV